MRVSKRTRYGVRLMLELALNFNKKPLSVNTIAVNEEISPKFLSQIIIPLRGAGLIQSTRGASGGYVLMRPPEEISVFDVFKVLEGDSSLTECVDDNDSCNRTNICTAKNIWQQLSEMIEVKLKAISFKELALQVQTLSAKLSPVYQI